MGQITGEISVYASLRRLFAGTGVNERNGDITSTIA